jgi:HEAT repeat protein
MTRPLLALVLLCSCAVPLAAQEKFESELARLVADLDSEDFDRVRGATAPLQALPKTSQERARVVAALTPLIERRSSADPHDLHPLAWKQVEAVRVLSMLGAEAEPALILALSLEESTSYDLASSGLAAIGPQVIPPMFKRLRALGWKRMASADLVLRKLGAPAFPAMKEAIQSDPSADVRFVVTCSFAHFGEAKAGPLLIATLRGDSDPMVRAGAAQALASRSDFWASAAPALLEALETEADPEARRRLAGMVGGLGVAGEPGIPALGAGYRGADSEQTEKAYAEALTWIGKSFRWERKQVRWWTLLQIYLWPCLLLSVVVIAWLLLAPRVGSFGLSGGALAAKTLVVALVPAGLVGGGAHYVLTRPWAEPFYQPLDPEVIVTPEVLASALGLVVGIAGWVAARWKVHAPGPLPPPEGEPSLVGSG